MPKKSLRDRIDEKVLSNIGIFCFTVFGLFLYFGCLVYVKINKKIYISSYDSLIVDGLLYIGVGVPLLLLVIRRFVLKK